MRTIILTFLLTIIVSVTFGQQQNTGKLIVTANFSNIKVLPVKIIIQKTSLNGDDVKSDTLKIRSENSKIKNEIFRYEKHLTEPGAMVATFYWPAGQVTDMRFQVVPAQYDLVICDDLQPVILSQTLSDFAAKITDIEEKENDSFRLSLKLVKNIDYKHKTIEETESRVWNLRDSIAYALDENVYKKYLLDNLNSAVGLYALWKYAERPYGPNQRIIVKAEEIKQLFDQLDPVIKQLPSGKALLKKL